MENLIKIKSESGFQLTDRELSVRWWGRLSVEEKQHMMEKYIPTHSIGVMDYETIYWVWLKKQ